MKRLKNLHLCRVVDQGKTFATGVPVSFEYTRNTERAPNFGPQYGQNIEPAGRYLSVSPGGKPPTGWERGRVSFKNPLVLALVPNNDAAIYGPEGWKARLKKTFKRQGRALSCALKREGYDAVVT